MRWIKPKTKSQSLFDYAEVAVRRLIRKASTVLETSGESAAWRVILDAIREQGEWMRLGAPSAMVIYQLYVANAVTFLSNFPDHRKAEALTKCAKADLAGLRDFLLQMKDEDFDLSDVADMRASVAVVNEQIRLLSVQCKK